MYIIDNEIEYKIRISIILVLITALVAAIIGTKPVILAATILTLFIPAILFAKFYISIKTKFTLALIFATLWCLFSFQLAHHWIQDLAEVVGYFLSYFIIFGIAIIPGFMSAFLVGSLLVDYRPKRRELADSEYPPITILIAAYNEGLNIESTLESISRQGYPAPITAIVINDGSKDNTASVVRECMSKYSFVDLLDLTKNVGKSNALSEGLKLVDTKVLLTIDGDCYLYKDALKRIVERYLSDPPNTVAVAGAVLVRNSRKNLVTKIQEWDYFHGIASIKRVQSLYQGTLVAQGAFSLYDTEIVRKVGAWPHTVGEDIVLTWEFLKQGYRVGFAEDACLFTNAPETWSAFIKQRQRWSRGLIEAFKQHWPLIFMLRQNSIFIWWNLLFPYTDLVYTLAFIPGLILAFFGIHWIAGPMTFILLPLGMILNYVMYRIQARMFEEQGLSVRKNLLGFMMYAFVYSLILQPASLWGYLKEIFDGATKNWGTK